MWAPTARAGAAVSLTVWLATGTAGAQGSPPTASFPEPEPEPPAPRATAPSPTPAAPPAAAAAPPPTPAVPPGPPPSGTGPVAPLPATPPTAPPVYEPPPPPPQPPAARRTFPELSARIDPFNLLLDGKLGIELEVAVLKWMTFELVPLFVVNETPPTFGYFMGPHGLARESNGWGPLAGTSFDVGFWLEGKAMRGNVLRVIMTNYSYEYVAPTDTVAHVERQLFGYFGSQSRWGAFTIAGGFGLGYELNQQRHCYYNQVPAGGGPPVSVPSDQCPDKGLFIRTNQTNTRVENLTLVDLSGGLGGVQIMARISFGVVF